MDNEIKNNKKDRLLPLSILVSAVIIAGAWIYTTGQKTYGLRKSQEFTGNVKDAILSPYLSGAVLPLKWGSIGKQMVEAGVIDPQKFEAIYAGRGGLKDEERSLLYGNYDDYVKISSQNSGFLLNMFWAFGLANQNIILEQGPMQKYGDVGNFASTGGWTVSRGDATDHYSRHKFVVLTQEQQQLVERVSKNIYRPCCNNPTYFPDCNHGMAMLGLLELLAAQGASEPMMYKVALQVNRLWFPDQYATISQYLQNNSHDIETADPKEILGKNYSSASGYRKILQEIGPQLQKSGVNCGVDGENVVSSKSSGSGCGI